MDLGKRIKETREKLGISGNELAVRIGTAQSAVWKIESGEVSAPSVFTVAAIAKALGVSLDDLVGDVELTPRPPSNEKQALSAWMQTVDNRLAELESALSTPGTKRKKAP